MRLRQLASTLLGALSFVGAANGQCTLDNWFASDGLEGDRFGTDVALSGDLALVGAGDSDDLGPGTGAAYVFRLESGAWIEEQKLLPPHPGFNFQFGLAVAIDGDVAVCGVPNDDGFTGLWSGAVEVFRFAGTSWNHEQRLTPSNLEVGARFGWAVDVDGDVIVVGARSENSIFNDAGAVYVFRFNGQAWVEEAQLIAPDAMLSAQFGHAVALAQDAIVIGAWRDDDAGLFTGAAYVFRHDGLAWQFEQKLNASDQGEFFRVGSSVGIDGDLVVVGAYEALVGPIRAGAAYVFSYNAGVWTEEAKLVAADTDAADNFAWSVDVSGELVAVGSRRDETPVLDSGSVYLFKRSGGVWSELIKFPSASGSTGQLGQSIAMSGDRVIAGGWMQDSQTFVDAGAVTVYSSGARCGAGQAYCDCASNSACGNTSSAGGCANSTGLGALLSTQGSASVSAADLQLVGQQLGPGTGLFFQGTSSVNQGAGSWLGDGKLCAGGAILRLGVVTSANGVARYPGASDPSIASTGAVTAGSTRFYQLWYRDLAGPCSTGFNLTNALRVDWTL